MTNPVYEEIFRDHTIAIYHDDDAEDSRKWDNFGRMVCWHRRYVLGDNYVFEDPRSLLLDLGDWCGDREAGFDRLYAEVEKRAVLLPLYLYDHGGITMNTTGFHCPWDSGQVGFIYANLDDIRREFGRKRVSAELRAAVADRLRGEVKVYDDFLRGENYGFVVTKNGEELESCWGFLGDHRDCCLIEARAAVPGG